MVSYRENTFHLNSQEFTFVFQKKKGETGKEIV